MDNKGIRSTEYASNVFDLHAEPLQRAANGSEDPLCYCSNHHAGCVRRVPLFSGVSTADLQDVVPLIQHRSYGTGERLFRADEPINALIIVRYGKLKLSRHMPNGEEVIVGILNEGDFYGGDQLFAGSRSREEAMTMEPTGVCLLSQAELEEVMQDRPELSLSLIHQLSKQVNREHTLLEIVSYKSAEKRVAAYLLAVTEGQQTAVVSMRQEDIAGAIHLTAETVNRKLQSLQKHRLIHIGGHRHIEILSPEGLQAILLTN